MDRPRIIVNVAATADGKIDSFARKGASISSAADMRRVDILRASVDAIVVGGQTLLNEDPKLTVKSHILRKERIQKGFSENPVKVGIVTKIPSPKDILMNKKERHPQNSGDPPGLLNNFLSTGNTHIFIFTTTRTSPEVISDLSSEKVTFHVIDKERVDLVEVFRVLYASDIHLVLVEGGGTLISELLRLKLVDELSIYVSPKIFGGSSAPTLADGPGFLPDIAPVLTLASVGQIDDAGGILLRYDVINQI